MMQIQEIFLAALEIDDLQQRADYLMQACGNDPVLHRKVTALLAAHEWSGEFLDIPALQQMARDLSQNEGEEEQKNAREEIDVSTHGLEIGLS